MRPVALVSNYEINRCRECGERIEVGSQVWWAREMGSAHRACGWTTKDGKVHPDTKSSIKDIPASLRLTTTKKKTAESSASENTKLPVFGQQESFMGPRF